MRAGSVLGGAAGLVVAALLGNLVACAPRPFIRHGYVAPPQLGLARQMVRTWPPPFRVETLRGGMPLYDGARTASAALALARAILHANPRVAPAEALLLSAATVRAARANGLLPEFLGATLLQESAYDVNALSPAGAIGVAQFMSSTAQDEGVDPFDPFDAIDGAAALLATYVRSYRGVYADPYAAALAAYNAGPGAVAYYRGIPPYAQTRAYVAFIFDRSAQIVSYERVRSGRARSAAERRLTP